MVICKLLKVLNASINIPLAILVLQLLLLSACGNEKEPSVVSPIVVKMQKVERGDVPIMKEFVGQTKGAIDAEIRARVEGVLTGVFFEEGKEVKAGQLLYTIDPAPFKAKVAEAMGTLTEAQTKLVKAESDLKRIRPLAEMKAVSERDLDAAIAQEGTARASVDAAKAAMESAEIQLSYCNINSPIDGVIGLSQAKVGEFVGRSPNPLVLNTVSKLDPINVRFAITEQDYIYFARLKQKEMENGNSETKRELELILADGSVYTEKGRVSSVNREIDPQTGSLTIEAAFPNPNKFIRPGQYAKVRSVVAISKGALLIPKRAIREMQGQYQVFVLKEDKTVDIRTIVAGVEFGELQAITSGLQEGDTIVTDGLQRLRVGTLVTSE